MPNLEFCRYCVPFRSRLRSTGGIATCFFLVLLVFALEASAQRTITSDIEDDIVSGQEASTQGTITVEWDRNPESDIAGYIVEYGDTSGTYPWEEDAGDQTRYTLTGLTPGGTYYIVVRAYNDANQQGPRSDQVVGTASGALTPALYRLTISKSGAGSGSVTSSPGGINCGSDCSESYASGTVVTLSAVADAGSTFSGWNGDADCVDGTVAMDAARSCMASFAIDSDTGEDPSGWLLTITKTGTGSGVVTSSPSGIDCNGDCSGTYSDGATVILTAQADSSSVFADWGGHADCADGRVTMTADRSCTASFSRIDGSPGVNGWATDSVSYYINPGNADVSEGAAADAIQVGAFAWGDQSSANIELVYGGLTSSTSVGRDSVNNVMFRPQRNGGTMATTYLWVDNGTIVGADVVFWDEGNSFFTGTSGCSGGVYVEDLAAHEFGLFLGLEHSSSQEDTMYDEPAGCSQRPRTLSGNDIAAVEGLYPPVGGETTPAAPSNLIATASSASPTSAIDLSWVDNADNETGYSIERSTTNGSYLEIRQVGADRTGYTDQNLPSDTTYWYRIRAIGSGGNSEHSNASSARTEVNQAETDQTKTDQGDPLGEPSGPKPTDGSTVDSRKVRLRWTSVSGAESYDVYFGTSPDPPFHSSRSKNYKAMRGLKSGPTYYWRVVAKNGEKSTAGPVWRFTVMASGGRSRGR